MRTFSAPLRTRSARLALPVILIGSALLPLGCSDSELDARLAAQSAIEDARTEAAKLGYEAGGTRTPLDRAAAFTRLARSLDSIDGASTVQAGAAAQLGAALSENAARLRMHSLATAAATSTSERGEAGRLAEIAAAMQQLISVQETMLMEGADARLASARADAEVALTRLRTAAQALDRPIGEARAARDADIERATELETEANALLQQANDRGAIAGFPLVERSASLRGEARPLKTAAARRDIELSQLEPDRTLVELSTDATQRLIESIDSTRAALNESLDALETNSNETRAALDVVGERVRALMASIEARRTNEIEPRIEEIRGDWNAAKRAAQRAVSSGLPKDGAESAKIALAGADRALFALDAMQLEILRDRAHMLARLAVTGDAVGKAADWRARLDAVNAAIETQQAATLASFDAALESIGRTSDGASIIESMNRLRPMIEGQPIELVAMEAPAARSSSGGGAVPAGGGFASPQAIADFLNSMFDRNGAGLERAFAPQTDPGRIVASVMSGSTVAMAPFVSAVRAEFGDDGGDATVGSISGDRGTLEIVDPTSGMSQDWPVIKRGDAWFVDADRYAQTSPDMAMLASIPAAQADQMLAAIQGAMRDVAREVAERVRDGEFSSAQEAVVALQQAMAPRMMQAMSGLMSGG